MLDDGGNTCVPSGIRLDALAFVASITELARELEEEFTPMAHSKMTGVAVFIATAFKTVSMRMSVMYKL